MIVIPEQIDKLTLICNFKVGTYRGGDYFTILDYFELFTEAVTLPFKEQCLKWHNEFRKNHQVNRSQYLPFMRT